MSAIPTPAPAVRPAQPPSMARRCVLAGLAGLAAWPCVQAQAPAGGAPTSGAAASGGALAQLREFLQSTRSARGSFTQRTQRGSGAAASTLSGVFAFQRPGRLRWEVRKPYEQLLVADGEKLYFLDRDLNQVTVRRLTDVGTASPAALLFGGGAELERSFELREDGSRDGLDWIAATPRSREAGFDRILVGLRAGLPDTMEVRDAFGRSSVFVFSGLERNPRLDAELFRFTVPRGADVVEQ
jgi:outer membrane lipoprotein carrier protein